MNTFATRAADIKSAKGSMINEGGKVKVEDTSIVVDTASGKWTLAFLGKDQLRTDLKKLAGLTVTCIYQEK